MTDAMTKRWRIGAVAVLGAISMPTTALAGGGAEPEREVTAAPTPGPVEYAQGDESFYELPEPIPAGEHGDLLRWQPIDSTFSLRYRIMYLSETVGGTPTVVTGLVELPDDRPPFGGLKALLYAHGSTGLDDPCSPSVVIDDGSGAAYADEFDSMSSAINDGWAVVATDYEGLGGPGSHPLLVGVSEARSILDAGRAARQLPVAYIGDTTALLGFLARRPRGAVGDPARRRMDP